VSDQESPDENAGSAMVPQKHGGAIWQGAPKNPKPGPGRPKGEVRQALLAIVDECGVQFVRDVLEGRVAGTTLEQQVRVAEMAMKYALGTQKEITVEAVRDKLGETIRILREELDEEPASRVLRRIREVWA
jgi:hypothetical protein